MCFHLCVSKFFFLKRRKRKLRNGCSVTDEGQDGTNPRPKLRLRKGKFKFWPRLKPDFGEERKRKRKRERKESKSFE